MHKIIAVLSFSLIMVLSGQVFAGPCLGYFDASASDSSGVLLGVALNCEARINSRLTMGGAVSLYHPLAQQLTPITDVYATVTVTPGRGWIVGAWAGAGVRWTESGAASSTRQFLFVTREGLAPSFSLFLIEGLRSSWMLVQARAGIKVPTTFGSVRTGFQLTWDDILSAPERPVPGVFGAVFF